MAKVPRGPVDLETVGWCLIPKAVMARDDLSLHEKVLLGRILALVVQDGYCYASNAWLGEQLRVSKHTVPRLVRNLAQKGVITVAVLRDESGQVIQRRIYPTGEVLASSSVAGMVSVKPGTLPAELPGPLHAEVLRPLPVSGTLPAELPGPLPAEVPRGPSRNARIVEYREEKREKNIPLRGAKHVRAAENGKRSLLQIEDTPPSAVSPPSSDHPSLASTDTSNGRSASEPAGVDGAISSTTKAQNIPEAPSRAAGSEPPYLPRNFSKNHSICQVLSRFADRWKGASGQTLDVSVARAIKEIQQRLKTTPLEDLLRLVDCWFDPGLSWVSPAERGAFHTFIQPRAVSELKGIKAGLSTAPAGRRAAGGYIKPLSHDEWADVPSGRLSFSQGRVVYHGESTNGPAAGDQGHADGVEVNTWR